VTGDTVVAVLRHREATMTKKLEVTGCHDCPLNEYLGGPYVCHLTKTFTGTGTAWAICPLKKGSVEIKLVRKGKTP